MYDDEEDYQSLCKRYGETAQEVYSTHYYWLRDKDSGKTQLSFARYDHKEKLRNLTAKQKSLKTKLRELEKEIQKLKKEKWKTTSMPRTGKPLG